MSVPLELTLSPLPPYRNPPAEDERVFEFGYRLRLPDGRLLDPSDPLLGALGAEVSPVIRGGTHEDALQGAWIEPGAPLTLAVEGHDEDGDAIVGVWDQDGGRCAGHLRLPSAARVAALVELSVEVRALALSEQRTCGEDRRTALETLIYLPATLSVALAAAAMGTGGAAAAGCGRGWLVGPSICCSSMPGSRTTIARQLRTFPRKNSYE